MSTTTTPGAVGEQLEGPLDRQRPGELGVDRQRVAGVHRHPHARARHREVGDVEDLAALVAELLLLVGLEAAVVDDLAGERQHVERDRPGELLGRRERHRLAVVGQLGGAVGDLTGLLVELVDTGEPGCRDTAWYVLAISRTSPASSWSGFSTGIAAIVVQLGLAMMPFGALWISPGLTSLTTSGTSGSIRHADELSITIAPAAANCGASSRDDVAPDENRAMSRPVGSASAASSTVMSRALPRQRGAGRTGRGEVPDLVDRELALGEEPAHHPADLTCCSDDTYPHGRSACWLACRYRPITRSRRATSGGG